MIGRDQELSHLIDQVKITNSGVYCVVVVNLGSILVVELIVVVTLGERSNLLSYSVVVELVEPYKYY